MKGWGERMWNAVFEIQYFYYISKLIADVANS